MLRQTSLFTRLIQSADKTSQRALAGCHTLSRVIHDHVTEKEAASSPQRDSEWLGWDITLRHVGLASDARFTITLIV